MGRIMSTDSQTVDLKPGETKEVHFEWSAAAVMDNKDLHMLLSKQVVGKPPKEPTDPHKAEQKKADAAAEEWLKTLDAAKKYGDCWDSAAKYLKDAVGGMNLPRN